MSVAAMGAALAQRRWAVEGAKGLGRGVAQGLATAGEQVVDVPAQLAARARLLDSGHARKTDLLTELRDQACGWDVRGSAGLARFPRRDRRWGCTAGAVRAGCAAAGVA
ncbi:MAG: hypothetical protein M3460_21645 [Actinomycetota bacterium]|nr:hypothetical protein [Actinomycetota bacterium]